jgi:hypothetical protein
MFGVATDTIVVSRTSTKVASITAMAINHGLKLGRHSLSPGTLGALCGLQLI